MEPDKIITDVVKKYLGYSDDQIKAASFVYWLTCLCENMITKPSAAGWGEIAKKGGYEHGETLTEFMFFEMTFISKMKVLKKQIELIKTDQNKFKPMLSFFECLNSVRNSVAHYKFSELKWKEEPLEDQKVREKVINEFIQMTEEMKRLHKS